MMFENSLSNFERLIHFSLCPRVFVPCCVRCCWASPSLRGWATFFISVAIDAVSSRRQRASAVVQSLGSAVMPPCLAARIFLSTMPMPTTRKLIVTSTLAFSAALSPGVQGFSVPATAVTVKRKRSSSSLFANKPKSSEASLPSESRDDPSAAALSAPQSKLYLLDEDELWESGVGNSATDDDSEAAECYIDDLDQHGESCLVSDTDSSLPAIRISVDADNIDVILKWVPILSPITAFFTYEITAEVFDRVIEAISDRTWVAVDGGKCN